MRPGRCLWPRRNEVLATPSGGASGEGRPRSRSSWRNSVGGLASAPENTRSAPVLALVERPATRALTMNSSATRPLVAKSGQSVLQIEAGIVGIEQTCASSREARAAQGPDPGVQFAVECEEVMRFSRATGADQFRLQHFLQHSASFHGTTRSSPLDGENPQTREVRLRNEEPIRGIVGISFPWQATSLRSTRWRRKSLCTPPFLPAGPE